MKIFNWDQRQRYHSRSIQRNETGLLCRFWFCRVMGNWANWPTQKHQIKKWLSVFCCKLSSSMRIKTSNRDSYINYANRIALSASMRDLLPFKDLLKELLSSVGLSEIQSIIMKTMVHEDSSGSLKVVLFQRLVYCPPVRL